MTCLTKKIFFEPGALGSGFDLPGTTKLSASAQAADAILVKNRTVIKFIIRRSSFVLALLCTLNSVFFQLHEAMKSTHFLYTIHFCVGFLCPSLCFIRNVRSPEKLGLRNRQSNMYAININQNVIGSAALVCGTTVGAGILALPSFIFKSGFIPSTSALLISWLAMVASGYLIAEAIVNAKISINGGVDRNRGLLFLADQTFGNEFPAISTFTGVIYVFLHNALLVAYIAEGGVLLHDMFLPSVYISQILFTLPIASLFYIFSESVVEMVNNALVTITIASFLILILIGTSQVDIHNLFFQNYEYIWSAFPIMLLALVYHNVVPVVCRDLEYNPKSIKTAIFLGTLVPFLMFVLWNGIILGSVDAEALLRLNPNVDSVSIDPVDIIRRGSSESTESTSYLLSTTLSVFSLGAIATSFIGFIVGLQDVYRDLLPSRSRRDPFM